MPNEKEKLENDGADEAIVTLLLTMMMMRGSKADLVFQTRKRKKRRISVCLRS